jgi:glycosyltransferase involved in cell wall biosynthesis
MKILYIAERINSEDGSSVHCRAFVDNAVELGQQVRTYPAIEEITYRHQQRVPKSAKNLWYYLRKINWPLIRFYLHRSNPYVSEVVAFVDGLIDSIIQTSRLRRLLNRFPADIIIYRYRLFNFAPYWVASICKTKIISEINSLKTMEAPLLHAKARPTALTKWAESIALKRSDVVVCVSQNLKRQIATISPDSAIEVVPNGVHTETFDPRRFQRTLVKAGLGLSDKFVIGYTGSYQNWHGLDLTLEIASLLKKIGADFHFLLIGHGAGFNAVQNKIRTMGLTDLFTQIKTVPHDDIPYHLAAFDCALMTYPKMEEFYFSPLKMFEYMAMEIPIISTAIGQIAEIITHGKTGLLVSSVRPEDFVQTLLKNRAALVEIGREARSLMVEQYSWRRNAERVVAAASMAIKGSRELAQESCGESIAD